MDPIIWFVLIGAVAGGAYVAGLNAITRKEAQVDAAWSGIEVQLARRHDLIPALVTTAQAALNHEKSLLAELAAARDAARMALQRHDKAEILDSEAALGSVISRLVRQIATSAQGAAVQNLALLQRQIEVTEDQIAAARRIYNSNAAAYNGRLSGFPGKIIAEWHGHQPVELWSSGKSITALDVTSADHLAKGLDGSRQS